MLSYTRYISGLLPLGVGDELKSGLVLPSLKQREGHGWLHSYGWLIMPKSVLEQSRYLMWLAELFLSFKSISKSVWWLAEVVRRSKGIHPVAG